MAQVSKFSGSETRTVHCLPVPEAARSKT